MKTRKKYEILIEDNVFCRLDKQLKLKIKELFKYNKTWWKKDIDGYGMDPEYSVGYFFGKTSFKLTNNICRIGDIPRIKKFCNENRIPIKIKYKMPIEYYTCKPSAKPKLKSIKFRKDQLEAINASKKNQYGRIICPTGSGKTITMLGICSMYPNENILILAHTRDLIDQLSQEANRFRINLPEIHIPSSVKQLKQIVNKLSDIHSNQNGMVITTIQSFGKLKLTNKITHAFDIIMVDEVHTVTKPDSTYGNVLHFMQTPRRYGFTATPPKKQPGALYNEGIFGPVIAELTMKVALQKDIVALPIVKLLNVPYDSMINQIAGFNYKNIYQQTIVDNPDRNQLIVDQVKLSMAFGNTSLIIVDKIEHGKILKKLLWQQCATDVPFVRGEKKSSERLTIKRKLNEGKILCAISTKVWMEGINIPNIKTIIYAAGMKEEKRVLQAMGRGLRTAENKTKITLVDFLDPYRYVSQHAILRVQIYNQQNWLN